MNKINPCAFRSVKIEEIHFLCTIIMKKLARGLLFVLISYTAGAQTAKEGPRPVRPRVNIDLDFAIPGGKYGDNFGFGFGGSGGLDIPVTRKFYATGSAGVISFYQGGKTVPTDTRSYIPMKVGAKYYLNQLIYVQMESGLAPGIQQGAGTAFILAPGAGISYYVSERSAINAGIRYESWSREGGNINMPVFKIGYQF